MEFFQKRFFHFLFILILFLGLIHFFFLMPPNDFKGDTIINIKEGASLRSISRNLKENNIIKSRIAFESFVIIYGGENNIRIGDYLFKNKIFVFTVAYRIAKGERNLAPIKITIPEGFDINDIAEIASMKLPNFNKEKFLELAKDKEGYLFPDTYFLFTKDTEEDLINLMTNNFEKKIKSLKDEISFIGKSEKEIIIMASIIEREAKGDMDRGFISGILWHRLYIDMPLQVDAMQESYKTKGLPDSPIANPGLAAIRAAMYPEESPYLFYLHGKDGQIYYAKNFKEHRKNIIKYLK